MEYKIPRIVLAGTNSGCGKTTVSCAVMQAFANRNLKVGAFKCGPDYIDPMFHSSVIGAKSSNLDMFFFDENTIKFLLAKNGERCDINIIEGVMGFYDGIALTTAQASTYNLAQTTESPVVLTVNAKGASLSVLAVIGGFLDFMPNNNICGVILNGCTKAGYDILAAEIEKHFGGRVKPCGFMPYLPQCSLESRHLGLITAQEVENLREKLQILAQQAEKTIDLDLLMQLAKNAKKVCCQPIVVEKSKENVRIGVAMDRAFCFYYADNLDMLRQMGAEIVYFSPLNDKNLPENLQGLYFGGGYPELYADKLSQNKTMLKQIKTALLNKVPCIAECGGFMYLTKSIAGFPMVGFFEGNCCDAGKLTRFGYVKLKAEKDNMLGKKGREIKAHEFHRWDAEFCGEDFTAQKPSGKSWKCVFADESIYAGFPHFHFYSNIGFAEQFYNKCLKEKHRYD